MAINLNILHHAGIFFDTKTYKNYNDWFDFVNEYLFKLHKKSKYLFFQVGNTANGEAIFNSDEVLKIMNTIFSKSGWEVIKIGIIEDLNKLEYKNYLNKNLDSIKLFKCIRNKKTNLVDYFYNRKFVKSLKSGFAQRPIWVCKSNFWS